MSASGITLVVHLLLSAPSAQPDTTDEFPVPAELEGRISFWEQVFGLYTSDRALLHDRENPKFIWQVIDFPQHQNPTVERKIRREFTRKATESLRKRLVRLEKKAQARDEIDTQILNMLGGEVSHLKGASTRVRSQQGVADKFLKGLKRSQKHIETIHAALDAAGVPRKLAALPFVESMFTPQARSSAGASGLWQLMPATARGLGLQVNSRKDERLNVRISTRAAARMLRDNYRMLGSWPLAITGYNHGPYGVKRATQELGTASLVSLIKRYKKSTWGFASKNFYAEFIAVSRLYEQATRVPAKRENAEDTP